MKWFKPAAPAAPASKRTWFPPDPDRWKGPNYIDNTWAVVTEEARVLRERMEWEERARFDEMWKVGLR